MSKKSEDIATKIVLQTLTKEDFFGKSYFDVRQNLLRIAKILEEFSISLSEETQFNRRRFFVIQYPNNDYYIIEINLKDIFAFKLKFVPYGGT